MMLFYGTKPIAQHGMTWDEYDTKIAKWAILLTTIIKIGASTCKEGCECCAKWQDLVPTRFAQEFQAVAKINYSDMRINKTRVAALAWLVNEESKTLTEVFDEMALLIKREREVLTATSSNEQFQSQMETQEVYRTQPQEQSKLVECIQPTWQELITIRSARSKQQSRMTQAALELRTREAKRLEESVRSQTSDDERESARQVVSNDARHRETQVIIACGFQSAVSMQDDRVKDATCETCWMRYDLVMAMENDVDAVRVATKLATCKQPRHETVNARQRVRLRWNIDYEVPSSEESKAHQS